MSSGSERPVPAEWRLSLALLLMLVGMLAGVVAELFDLPFGALTGAVALFAAGGVCASVLAYRDARAGQISVLRAIGRALKMAFGWIFFLP